MAQWENECTSLADLSMTRAMMAKWENECISLSVLSVALVMIALIGWSTWVGLSAHGANPSILVISHH